jgi:hypothetical protein
MFANKSDSLLAKKVNKYASAFKCCSRAVLSQPNSRFSLSYLSLRGPRTVSSNLPEIGVAIHTVIAQSNHRRRNLVSPANSKVQYQKAYFSDSTQPSELGHRRRFCHVATRVPLFLALSIAFSAIIRYSTFAGPSPFLL